MMAKLIVNYDNTTKNLQDIFQHLTDEVAEIEAGIENGELDKVPAALDQMHQDVLDTQTMIDALHGVYSQLSDEYRSVVLGQVMKRLGYTDRTNLSVANFVKVYFDDHFEFANDIPEIQLNGENASKNDDEKVVESIEVEPPKSTATEKNDQKNGRTPNGKHLVFSPVPQTANTSFLVPYPKR